MGTALRGPHSLVPESVETNRAALRFIVRITRAIGFLLPLRTCCRQYFHVVVVFIIIIIRIFGTFGTLKKRRHM